MRRVASSCFSPDSRNRPILHRLRDRLERAAGGGGVCRLGVHTGEWTLTQYEQFTFFITLEQRWCDDRAHAGADPHVQFDEDVQLSIPQYRL